ncbi:zinc ABC transporter substrate-binding protein [bacterium]|nr:zinc ABC transporter substrate-binding protein [bacterium]
MGFWSSALPVGASEPLSIFVSILPQALFVERVGGKHVKVEVMVRPGHSPATYEPTPKQILALAGAKIYFRIGVPFEETWMERIKSLNPGLHIVDTRQGIRLRDKDPHIWLSPRRVKIQAATIRNTLASLDIRHQKDYDENLRQFQNELTKLDQDLKTILAPLEKRRFMVFHPSWGYFAADYGLEMVPIEIEGKDPGPRTLARLIVRVETQGFKTIFVQQQFSNKTAAAIAKALDARVVVIDPLAPDYFTNLRRTAKLIAGQDHE